MRKVMTIICSALLGVGGALVPVTSVSAAPLSYPAGGTSFPECSTDDQEFCVEGLWFTPVGGSESEISAPTNRRSEAWVNAGFFQGAYVGPTTAPAATGLMPILNANVYNSTGFADSGIQDGLVAGTYRFRLRIGDYDPTYTVIQARAVSHEVERGADGYFTLEVSAETKPWMSVQGASATVACIAGKWKTNCEATHAYRNWLGTAIVMHGNSSRRDISRGQWFSTSAAYFVPSAPTANGPEAKQTLTVAGPHFVPNGFGNTGRTENGRYLNRAYYRTFIPYTAVINSLKLANVSTTKEAIQAVLATRSIFTGTIVNERGVAENRQLTVTAQEGGVIIDFNLDTFSAPNPTLYISNPARSRRTLRHGATISPLSEASRGRKLSRVVLIGPGVGTKVTSVSSSTKKQCAVRGSAVVMLKAGRCKLSVRLSTKVGKRTMTTTARVVVTVK